MKYWWSQDHSHKVWAKSETIFFFFEIEGSPLWIKKNFWLRFWWNSKFLILMALGSYIQNFSKIGDKIFFDMEGSPLWIRIPLDEKKILILILMKLKIFDPYGLGILQTKFLQNQGQIFFWHRRVPRLDKKKKLSPIWMKVEIWNTDGLRITPTNF